MDGVTGAGLTPSGAATATFKPLILPDGALAEIQEHAKAEYPKEACGAITPEGYLPLINVHKVPDRAFDCRDACNQLEAEGRLLAVVHSHPDGPLGPSSWDMRQQMAMDIPWGLVATDGVRVGRPFFWGDSLEPPPLLRRDFRHGPSGTDGKGDCYALVRDWFRMERGIVLPECPRNDNWWAGADGGDNLYLNGLAKSGFVDIGRNAGLRDPRPGDCFLAQVRARTPNHGGVYIGNGQILHHPGNSLSITKPLGEWVRLVTHWLRYEGPAAEGAL
jgi:proteasome lid subunit RPN8/RPN11